MIKNTPIFVNFDRRREVVFNLNTEILIRNNGAENSSLWKTIGKRVNAETGAEENVLDVNLDNLRLYLWAALQEDSRHRGETFTIEEVGGLLRRRKWVYPAMDALTRALNAYYGDDPADGAQGEASAPAGE